MSDHQTRTPTRVMLAGRLSIVGDGAVADEAQLQGRQPRLTFAVLVLERGRLLPRDELADVLWPDKLPGTWESALRNVVSRVRDFLAAAGIDAAHALRHEAGCYRLALPAGTIVDVEEAERLVDVAGERLAAGDVEAGLAAAEEAHRTLAAPVLPGIDHPWLDRVRLRLGELALRAAEHEAEGRLLAGDHRAALAIVEAVIDAAPFRESAHRLAMQVHDAAGNRAEALRAYERCRRMLAEELGVDPSPATEAIYLGLLGSEPPQASTPSTPTEALRPTGTVTFLFSGIERSAAVWERDGEGMAAALQLHDDLMRDAVEEHGGRIFRHTGEGVGAVFAAARDAVGAGVQAQRRLVRAEWPTADPLRVRLALHTGEAELRGDDYTGATVHRAARLCSAGQGGQVLVSTATRIVVDGRLPTGVELRHAGELPIGGSAGPEAVFQVVHADLPAEFAVLGHDRLGSSTAVDGPLIGRADDLAHVEAALVEARLVTIVGPGGVGKTRLAHAFATETELGGEARALWADLAGGDATAVLDAVATAVGADRAGVDVLDATVAALRATKAVLVLDNCEHVIEAAAEVATSLVGRCETLRVLATSQAPLGVADERLVAIGPLTVPADGADYGGIVASPAVEVFVRRARAANPAFELSPDNTSAIAEVCRRLDGLPLALELAAARVRSVAPAQIVAHLDERFRLLRTARRDTGPRHSSLDAAMRWSHELLADRERLLFDRLSVFAGVFDLDAAMTVAAPDDADGLDVLEALDTLVERSMLLAVESSAQTRYRLLESLREFGRQRLDERGQTAELVDRHRAHHLALVEAAAVGVRGPDEATWVDALHRALPDVRTAFAAAAAEGDVDCCLRIAASLFDYGFFRMQRQVGLWAAEAVALPGAEDHPSYADAAATAGFLAWSRGDFDAAHRWAGSVDGDTATWLANDALGTISMYEGNVQQAIDHWERAGELARAAANRYEEAVAVGQMAFGHMLAGSDAAVELALRAKELAASTRNPTANAHAAWSLGVALYDKDPEAALAELEASMTFSNMVDNRLALGSARVPAEELRTKLADRSSTLDLRSAMDSLEYWASAGNPPNLWSTVRRVARTLADLGEHRGAALALGAEMSASLKLPLRERERTRHEAVVARVHDALGEASFRSAVARASSLTPQELVTELRRAVDSIVRRS